MDEQGSRPVWAVILMAAAPLVAIAALVASLRSGDRSLSSHDADTAGRAQSAESAAAARGEPSLTAPAQVEEKDVELGTVAANSGDVERFERFNFHFAHPNGSWLRLQSNAVAPEAALTFVRGGPRTLFYIITESLGVEANLGPVELYDAVRYNALKHAEDATFTAGRQRTVAGVEGIVLESETLKDGTRTKTRFWVGAHGGVTYQLVAQCDAAASDLLEKRHEEMLACFSLIDPQHMVHVRGQRGVETFESAAFGYRLDLARDGWTPLKANVTEVKAAEYAASWGDMKATFVVNSLVLPADDVPLEDLARLFLNMWCPDPDSGDLPELRPLADGSHGAGFTRTLQRTSGTIIDLRGRVYQRGRLVHFVAGIAVDGSDKIFSLIDRGLNSFELLEPQSPTNSVGTETQQQLRAGLITALGIMAGKRENLTLAGACYAEAVALCPSDHELLGQCLALLLEAGATEEALKVLDGQVKAHPEDFEMQLIYAELLSKSNRRDEAVQVYEKFLADGCSNLAVLRNLIALYLDVDEVDKALAACDAFVQDEPTPLVDRWRGQLYSRAGRHDEAIAVMQRLCDAEPDDPQARNDLADSLVGAERYAEALALTAQAIDEGRADDCAYVTRGVCQMKMKSFRDAKQSFEQAAAINPASEDARDGIAVASAMLGQGDNSALRSAIEAVAIPPEIAARLAELPPPAHSADDFGAYEVYRVTGYWYVPGRPRKETTYRKIKLLRQEGVARYKKLQFEFNPLAQRAYVNRLAVFDADGRLVAQGNVDEYFMVDSNDEFSPGKSVVSVPVASLRPGCTLEFVYTVESAGPDDEFGFEEVQLSSEAPTQAAGVFVTGAVERIGHASTGPLLHTSRDGAVYCGVTDPPLYLWEARQAPRETFLPIVTLSDADATWESEGADYLDDMKDQLVPDPQIEQLAGEITAGLATNELKIAALAGYVQKQITYQAIEFGVRGVIPNAACKTLELRYGDCKDHSVLLKQLLNAAGIAAELTLIRTDGNVAVNLPTLDQFDHVVVVIPPQTAEGRPTFLDCTTKHSDPAWPIHAHYDGQQAFVLDPRSPRLVVVPPPAEGYRITCRRDVQIAFENPNDDTAHIIVREDLLFGDGPAGSIREALAQYEPRDRLKAVADLLLKNDRVRLSTADLTNFDDPAAPLVVHLEYRIDDAFHQADGPSGLLVGSAPRPWETLWIAADDLPQRTTPFQLRPFEVETTVTFTMPPGYRMRQPAASQSAQGNRFVMWSVASDPSTTCAVFRVRQMPGRSAAADYASYFDETRRVLAVMEKPVQVETIRR